MYRASRNAMKIPFVILALLGASLIHASAQTVTVHLLDHTGKKETKSRFWIDWSDSWRDIVTTKAASKEDARKITLLLRTSLTNAEASHFCGHDPIYGIEATDSAGKALKTSLCFTCLTWVKPGKRLVIAGKTGAENDLCKVLRSVIELPEELLEAAKKSDAAQEKPGSGDKTAEPVTPP